MTMFDVDTVNVEKKLQEIEDNDLYNFMKKQNQYIHLLLTLNFFNPIFYHT